MDPTSVLNWLSTYQCLFAPMAQSQGALGEEEEEEEEEEDDEEEEGVAIVTRLV